jgi:hypothetical protein
MSLIHNNDHGALSEDWARFYAANIFLALEHLHEQVIRNLQKEITSINAGDLDYVPSDYVSFQRIGFIET